MIQETTIALPVQRTVAELRELDALEQEIANDLRGFIRIGTALKEISERRLYRGAFETFEDYAKERWSISRQYAYRLIHAVEIRAALSPIGDMLPETESQVRALSTIAGDQRQTAWERAVEAAPEVDGEKHVTAKVVATVVRKMLKERRTQLEEESRTREKANSLFALDVKSWVRHTGKSVGNVKTSAAKVADTLDMQGDDAYQAYVAACDQLKSAWDKLRAKVKANPKLQDAKRRLLTPWERDRSAGGNS